MVKDFRFKCLAILTVFSFMLSGCSSETLEENQIRMSITSKSEKGEHFEDTVSKLLSEGFTNVSTEAIPDLITGWLTKEGSVELVTLNDAAFEEGDIAHKDDKIVVKYHAFPEDEPDDEAGEVETPVDEGEAGNESEVITAANNEEFAAVLNAKNPSDPVIIEFVEKYKGKVIQFDGYSWDWFNHTTTSPITGKEKVYDTQFTTNFYVGDYENADTNTLGPIFRAEGVTIPSFNDSLNRANMTITATVSGFKESHEFFELSSVTMEAR